MKSAAPAPPLHDIRSDANLRSFQRIFLEAIVHHPNSGHRVRNPPDVLAVATRLVKPAAKLSPEDRLRIYSNSYWGRLMEAVEDHSPALRALLGRRRFEVFARAYLARHPSRSFTLRNLCTKLADFVLAEPRLTAPHTKLAHAIARFEHAQTIAFDGASRPALTKARTIRLLRNQGGARLQPYVSLLALDWPVDDFVPAIGRREFRRDETSNVARLRPSAARPRFALPLPRKVWLVVHRHELKVYCKRIVPCAFSALEAIAQGKPLVKALAATGPRISTARLYQSLEEWVQLGWLCVRP
jgi:hypothetical protein